MSVLVPSDAGFEGAGADVDLVRAAQGGDRVAFGLLVKRYQNTVCGIAYALTGRISVSEEVAQDTFTSAWRSLGEIRGPERFRSWIMSVARRASLRALRDQRTTPGQPGPSLFVDEAPSAEPSPLDRIITREQEEMVWGALKRIPESYRVPLVLFYRESRSIQQVAQALDMSEENVKKRLSRARRMVAKHLEELVESALSGTRVGRAFTAGVMALLAAIVPDAPPAHASRPASIKLVAIGGAALLAIPLLRVGLREKAPQGTWAAQAGLAAPPRGDPRRQSDARGAASRPVPILGVPSAGDRTEGTTPVPGVAFDFEDGVLPDGFSTGHVAPCPARSGHCLLATLLADGVPWWYAGFRTPVRFSRNLVMKFDYWMDRGRAGMDVVDGNRHVVFMIRLPNVVLGAWGHAEVRLGDGVSQGDPSLKLQDGDVIRGLQVWAGGENKSLYIDNVSVVEEPPADP